MHPNRSRRCAGWLFWAAAGCCVVRFWLMALPNGFWIDEAVTAFVVRYGHGHSSFAVAPQVAESVYYVLPAASGRLFGFSEAAYRIPSLLAIVLALFFTTRIAVRLVAPESWRFVLAACLALGGISREAVNARFYAVGICVAAAGVYFLIRWLDSGRSLDAALFAASAALLWRIHLLYWPFYLVFAAYTAVRKWRGETVLSWQRIFFVAAAVALALLPVALRTPALLREARAHSWALMPGIRIFYYSLKPGMLLMCIPFALLAYLLKWPRHKLSLPAAVLVFGWWSIQPLALFALSHATGNSVYTDRYLTPILPGIALGTAFLLSRFLRPDLWDPAALILILGVLAGMGHWKQARPDYFREDWRGATRAINAFGDSDLPVLCPSPFIEALSPKWTRNYGLPGFLYTHLAIYPVRGTPYLLPFRPSPEAEEYAGALAQGPLPAAGRFVIYGGKGNAKYWRDWLLARRELEGWSATRLGDFGDVEAFLLRAPWTPPSRVLAAMAARTNAVPMPGP